jgi:biopolymer transport protein ExbD
VGEQLGTRLDETCKEPADKIAFVQGDEDVRFARVARSIDMMGADGVNHAGLTTPVDNRREPLF